MKSQILLNIAWHGKLGDCIISSGFLKSLAKSDTFNVITLTSSKLHELHCNDYCSDVIISNPNETGKIVDQFSKMGISIHTIVYLKGKISEEESNFIKMLNSKYAFTLDQNFNQESYDLYQFHLGKPFVHCYQFILTSIGEDYDENSTKYKIGRMNPIKITDKNIALFNPFASREDKSISLEKSIEVLNEVAGKHPEISFIIMHEDTNTYKANEIIKSVKYKNIKLSALCSCTAELFYMVSAASFIISVDTAIVHIAQALCKPMIAIYPKLKEYNVWSPLSNRNVRVINAKQDESYTGFGPKNMNDFKTSKVLKAFREISSNSSIVLDGKLTKNLNVAHKNLAMQLPFFCRIQPELTHVHNGTINIVFNKNFRILEPSFSIDNLLWTESKRTTESFAFLRVILHVGKLTIPAWLYSPSNSPHKNRLEFKEIITERIDLKDVEQVSVEILDLQSVEFVA